MGSTCRDIITAAYQEIGTIGARALDAREGVLGLRRLTTLLADLAGMGIGEPLKDLSLIETGGPPSADCMPLNVRVLVDNGATSVPFPAKPQNGSRFAVVDVDGTFEVSPCTLSRNGRKIEGATADLVANTAGFAREWFYRADLASWQAVSALALSDDFPLAPDCEDAFAVILASRLAPTDGATVSADTGAAINRAISTLKARHKQTIKTRAPTPILRCSLQSYGGSCC